MSDYNNLIKLFKSKPLLGWGSASDFNFTCVSDIKEACEIIEGQASMSIVLERRDYLKSVDDGLNPKIPFKQWLNEIVKKEDTYRGYMLRTFAYNEGQFILKIDIYSLDNLAGLMLGYLLPKKQKSK